MKVVLFSYNASHYHTNLAIRCLSDALFCSFGADIDVKIIEFSLKDKRMTVLDALHNENADIYAFSSYIWNITETLEVASNIKKLHPCSKIVFGGPEVSYTCHDFLSANLFVDCVLCGEGEEAICSLIKSYPNIPKVIVGEMDRHFLSRKPHYFLPDGSPEPLQDGVFLYYESSRGCIFNCSYCLSAGSHPVRAKSSNQVLDDLLLFEKFSSCRRTIKFVDRTFNFNITRAKEIWQGLLDERFSHTYHFELQASLLDEECFDIFRKVSIGKFQFEIGIQSTDEDVLKESNRKANIAIELANLYKIKTQTQIPVHGDLICGLPLDNYQKIQKSFNDLIYTVNELQLGFLKILKGAPISETYQKYGMVFSSYPPYQVMQTNTLSFDELYKLSGIANTVNRVFNSQRFVHGCDFLFKDSLANAIVAPFSFFEKLSDVLHGQPSAYSQISMYENFLKVGYSFCEDEKTKNELKNNLKTDYSQNERTKLPSFLH